MATKFAAAKQPVAKTKAGAKAVSKKPPAKGAAPKASPVKAVAQKAEPAKKITQKPVAAKPAVKAAPAKAVALKAAQPVAAPVRLAVPAKPVAKAATAAAKPAPAGVAPVTVKVAPAKAAPLAVKSVEVKKIAGLKTASQPKGLAFDPDKRRELIAAAAARHQKAGPAKFAGPRIDPIAVREPTPVERHRFSVGDPVKVISTSGMWFKHGVAYKVTAALPPAAGGKLQYRIKNDQEPFERVVSESQLASV